MVQVNPLLRIDTVDGTTSIRARARLASSPLRCRRGTPAPRRHPLLLSVNLPGTAVPSPRFMFSVSLGKELTDAEGSFSAFCAVDGKHSVASPACCVPGHANPSPASLGGLSAAACLLSLLGWSDPAPAGLIVAYNAANSTGSAAASEMLPAVVPLDLSRGAGLSAGTGGTYNSSGWTDELTDYLQWGWSASPPLSLTDLDLRYDRSASGPASLEIRLSANGGPFETVFVDSAVSEAGEDNLNIDLSRFTGVTSATFRLFGEGASSAGGTFDIEPLTGVSPDRGIVVNGIASVPEPSAICLSAIAVVTLGLRRATRRTR